MLRAITADMVDVAEVVVPLDSRFSDMEITATETVSIDTSKPLWSQWIAAARSCDAALIIAPELDGTLTKAVSMLRAGGIDVIAGSGDFLRVASDKLLTAKHLIAAGVAHPIYMALSDKRFADALAQHQQFVVKPRDGCGTQEIQRFNDLNQAKSALEENSLLQAWMPGRAISIALVASATQMVFLPAVSQSLCEGTCEYNGGQGPLDDDAQRRATALAMRAIEAMPPLVRGFVGLDLLLGDRPSEDYVIEINPRLTTSYVGLRRMINGNLAARLFDLEGGPVSCCTSVDSVRWTPDGRVWINDAIADTV